MVVLLNTDLEKHIYLLLALCYMDGEDYSPDFQRAFQLSREVKECDLTKASMALTVCYVNEMVKMN